MPRTLVTPPWGHGQVLKDLHWCLSSAGLTQPLLPTRTPGGETNPRTEEEGWVHGVPP